MVATAFPRMSTSLAQEKAKSTATSLAHFISEAKSIAIIRNQKLWIKISLGDISQGIPWSLALASSVEQASQPAHQLLFYQGSDNIQLESGYLYDQIMLDGIKGKISNGHLLLNSAETRVPDLKVISSYDAARIRVCAVEEAIDGFPQC
jgi:Tfp pilus assembly protein FimT